MKRTKKDTEAMLEALNMAKELILLPPSPRLSPFYHQLEYAGINAGITATEREINEFLEEAAIIAEGDLEEMGSIILSCCPAELPQAEEETGERV